MNDNNNFDSERAEILKRWLRENVPGMYTIEESQTEKKYSLKVSPKNSAASQVSIYSQNGSTQIHLGSSFFFDEFDGLYADDGSIMTSRLSDYDLLEFISAIAKGRLYELVWYRFGEICRELFVQFHAKELRQVHWLTPLMFRRPGIKRKIQYEAYLPT